MSISDELMFLYFELVTDVAMDKINSYKEGIKDGSVHPKDVKVELAKNICEQFYDGETADKAEAEFNKMFVKKDLPDEVPDYNIPEDEKKDSKIWIVRLLVLAGMAKSNGEGRRLIQGGGVSIDGEKVSDGDYELPLPFQGILKVGKRRFVKIIG